MALATGTSHDFPCFISDDDDDNIIVTISTGMSIIQSVYIYEFRYT